MNIPCSDAHSWTFISTYTGVTIDIAIAAARRTVEEMVTVADQPPFANMEPPFPQGLYGCEAPVEESLRVLRNSYHRESILPLYSTPARPILYGSGC